ncbi:phage tail protein I [Burkholderia sp. TSV86]|uniref:phage tail protein I n=1 Tax=Burkholderia sp. TSV86 TaxID=1385594 RepID=UPI000758CC34|nr:phage tail protein I [Burkholderia sp. TSV86]KVE33901.1 hypothetical protein WS68_00835 [Burkholderia sp. TSV86]
MASLLPPNAAPFEVSLAESVARISDVPTPVRDIWNADRCPSDLLPWLAWAFSVDFWDANWLDEQKRNSIQSAVAVQRYKGTIGAVKQALDALGYTVTIQEWFQQIPPAAPYTFSVWVDSSQSGIDQDGYGKIISYIRAMKNLRSHFGSFQPSVTTRGGPVLAGVLTIGNNITISYDGTQLVDRWLDGSWNLDGAISLSGTKV